MEFHKRMTLQEIANKDVTVFLNRNTPNVEMFECSTFLVDGALWIDCYPEQYRKHVLPLPGDAIISRNELELSIGRYGIVVRETTELGRFLSQLETVNT